MKKITFFCNDARLRDKFYKDLVGSGVPEVSKKFNRNNMGMDREKFWVDVARGKGREIWHAYAFIDCEFGLYILNHNPIKKMRTVTVDTYTYCLTLALFYHYSNQ